MATMGRYCKAYPLPQLRAFPQWREEAGNARPEPVRDDGDAAARRARALGDEDFLFVQEDYTVTDGVFLDECIVFRAVTPEWIAFCRDTLAFTVPEFDRDGGQPPSSE